jgi:TatD DNase family protein
MTAGVDGGLRWTDDHCHLHFGEPDAPAIHELVDGARAAGVERMVTVGCDVADSQAAVAVARAHAGVVATAGVHPHEAQHGIEGLADLLSDPMVVAVGECGLDFHYDHSPRDAQRAVFADQIALAHEHALPLVIHTRSAWPETFDLLAAEGLPERTVFHCFTGGPDEARRCLDLGAHLSFSGIVTFKSADDLRAAAALCPLDRLLVETDAPYLAPVPHRGETNRPALVPLVGAGVAAAAGHDLAVVADATWRNAAAFYDLDQRLGR